MTSRRSLASALLLLAAAPAGAQHLIAADTVNGRFMLFDRADGSLVDANFMSKAWIAPGSPTLGWGIEAVRVENEIWVSNQQTDSILRFSLDGRSVLGEVGGGFWSILQSVAGIAYDGATVHAACHQVGRHGTGGAWIARMNPQGAQLGTYDLVNDERPVDVHAHDGALLIVNADMQGVERRSGSGSFLGWAIAAGSVGAFPGQITVDAAGDMLVATTTGLQRFDPAGALVRVYLEGTDVNGVAPLDSGDLLVSFNTGFSVLDAETGELTPIVEFTQPRMTGFISAIDGLAPCPADADGDGSVGVADLLAFLDRFRTGDQRADFDGNMATGVQDLLGWLRAFRAGC